MSALGRLVLILWLFVALILSSSYTASLTSILTVERLSCPDKGIEILITSNDPIGFSRGSFVENYLTDELHIQRSRLVPLDLPTDYERALKDGPSKGGVAVVVDDRAYMELFLSTRCEFRIVGQFSKMGWGFVSITSNTSLFFDFNRGGMIKTQLFCSTFAFFFSKK